MIILVACQLRSPLSLKAPSTLGWTMRTSSGLIVAPIIGFRPAPVFPTRGVITMSFS